MVNIQPHKNSIGKKEIAQIEAQIKHKLPQEYINFLMKYNAGIPEPNIVALQDSKVSSFSITSFFGINVEDYNELSNRIKSLNQRIPYGCLPFAHTEFGNILCLNLNDNGYGNVLFWDHEKELLHDHDIDVEHLEFISKSFNEFIDLIRPYNPDDEDLSSYEVKEAWIDPDFLKEINKGN
jgi:hypothetical protein